MNFLHMFFGFGAILAPALAVACLGLGSWRLAFLATAIPPAVVTILLWPLAVARSPIIAAPAEGARPYRSSFVWIASFAIFVYLGIEATMSGWMPSYWGYAGSPALPAPLTVTVFWVAVTVGRMVSGFFADRLGLGRFIVLMSLATVLVGVGWCIFPGPPWTLVTIVLIGLCVAGMYPTVMASATARHPARTGEVAAIVSFAAGLGGFLVAAGIGRLADLFDLGVIPLTTLGLSLAMTLGAVMGWHDAPTLLLRGRGRSVAT